MKIIKNTFLDIHFNVTEREKVDKLVHKYIQKGWSLEHENTDSGSEYELRHQLLSTKIGRKQ